MNNIQHDTENKRFYITLPNDKEAEIKYRLLDDNVIDFYSTFTPNTARGKGFAAALVEHGFSWAREQGKDIHASCWYARKFLPEND